VRVYTLGEGERLVKAARQAVESCVSSSNFDRGVIEKILEGFDQKSGVFVTIYNYPTRTLRGCIGFIEGIEPIKKLVVDAAIAAASEDPRFAPISLREFEHIVMDVSVLSKVERVQGAPEEIKRQIMIGRDGLIVEYGYYRGLLLPIVAAEEGWNPEEFLENTCSKAGLPEHLWKQQGVLIYKFTTQVFRELSPGGRVEEVRLKVS
jgi:hypothetical protein